MSGLLYLASVLAANILVKELGIINLGWFVFPAGTVLIGFVFTSRDMVQREYGKARCWWWMGAACALTAIFSASLAVASVAAFAVSETIDWIIFTRCGGSFVRRVWWSSLVATPIDSAVFVCLAFGPGAWLAIIGQSALKLASSLVLAVAVRRMQQ